MIPDETIDRVRESADIVQIIGEHVNLKRTGTDFRGPCPFHQGTHRNFSVSPRKGIYYCFVCHEGGDVFTFLQKRLGMDWPTAVRHVADKVGIEIREIDTRRDRGIPDPREPLWEVNAAAADYFRRVLWEDDLGAAARAYLAQRDIPREVADRFGLGFAPREIGLMRAHLETLGFDEPRQLEAGLLVRPEDSAEPRPRFRGRLTFPIFDAQGRTIAFGGRLIAPGEPKYLNSAESPVFSKGQTLYGLNWARHAIRKEDRALVVEGYFDVVRLAAAGIDQVVAPLGTALTEQQAQILRRHTANVFLLYDSDEAGLKATFRAGLELLREGAAVRVVTMPEGEDPDTYVRTHGAAAMEKLLAGAMDLFDRQVQILERRGWFSDLNRKRRAIDKLLPTIRATADPLTRDIYTARLAEAAGVDKGLVAGEAAEQKDVRPGRRGGTGGHAVIRHGAGIPAADDYALPDGPPEEGPPPDDWQPSQGGDSPPWKKKWKNRFGDRRGRDRRGPQEWQSNEAPPRAAAEVAPERNLVSLLLVHRAMVERASAALSPAQLDDPRLRAIYAALVELGGEASLDEVAATLDEPTQAICFALAQQDPPVVAFDAAQAAVESSLGGVLAVILQRELDRRSAAIDQEMLEATPERQQELLREKIELLARQRELGSGVRVKSVARRKHKRS